MTAKSDRPRWLELKRILPLDEVEKLTSLSNDSLERNYPDRIRQLSKRRKGMQLADVLEIVDGRAAESGDGD
jgi:hypothetical protein